MKDNKAKAVFQQASPQAAPKTGPVELAFVFVQFQSGEISIEALRVQDGEVIEREMLYDRDSPSIILAKFSRDIRYKALTGQEIH